MKSIALVLLSVAVAAFAQDAAAPDPFAGTFRREQLILQLAGSKGQYTGTLTVQGRRLPAAARVSGEIAEGTYELDGRPYSFTLTPYAGGLKLTAEGLDYRLERSNGTTAGPAAPPAGAARPSGGTGAAPVNSLVGLWRNAQGSARFNADGTGTMDGNAGKYEVNGNQVTLISAQGRLTLAFEVRGETLTLSGSGGQLVLNRVVEEPGPGRVRAELVGKWCWISVVSAQQGARTSNQCFVLNGDGSYQYSGQSDSYNPNGGATSESADSGTWTATETTFTAQSRTRGRVIYNMEKRNHPKTGDPMLIMNGQSFVTYFQHSPW